MKNIISAACFSLLFSCGNKNKLEGGYYVFGKIKNAENETVFIEEIKGNQAIVIDSTKINNREEFEMTGMVKEKKIYSFRVANKMAALFFLENKEIEINADLNDFDNYQIFGSEESSILKKLNGKIKQDYQKLNELKQKFNEHLSYEMQQNIPDSLKQTFKIDKKYSTTFSEQQKFLGEFIDTIKDAMLAMYAAQFVNPDFSFASYKTAAEKVKNQIPNSEDAKVFLQNVENLSKLAIGAEAPEINLPDPDGKDIALSSFKGKVVLIDFWASWCRPCRMENPELVRIYEQFKNKNFVIYSVSLDREKNKWTDAIKQDKLVWKEHVLVVNPQAQSPSLDYQVASIPTSYLIDKEGKIAAKNPRGEELEKKIESLLQ